MSLENLKEELESILEAENNRRLHEFLDEQNISDVAELVYELPDYDSRIIAAMSVHRAVGVFKILDFTAQKKIIQTLPPDKTAALLNELPPDDRTDFLEELPSNVVRELISFWTTRKERSPYLFSVIRKTAWEG